MTSISTKINRIFILFAICFLVLVLRVVWIQAVQGTMLAERLKSQLMDNKAINMPRGSIYDRNGRELAMSVTVKSLYADPMMLNADPETVARILAPVIGMKEADIVKKLHVDGNFVWLRRMMDRPMAEEINHFIKDNKWEGLAFVEESKRYYPNDDLAAQVIGFVGMDDNGLAGIELEYDSKLSGGRYDQWMETDAFGTPIFDSIMQYVSKRQGKAIYLAIDQVVQAMVEQALDRAVQNTKSDGAVCIIMDPHTGDILAMASRPTFDLNNYDKANPLNWRNKAISMVYEPGSTFKPVVAAAAMQLGLVTPAEPMYDGGTVAVGSRIIKNWDGSGLGAVTFTDVIKYSLNTGFVNVGLRMTANQELDFVEKFGFGQSTQINLPGEETGILFSRADMTRSDQASMSIGQGIAVTPIQLVRAIAAIANGGMLLEPHIVREVRDADGSVEYDASTVPVQQVIQPEVAASLAKMMQQVISDGGGKRASVKGYSLAGKTGTAEKLKEGGGYSGYIASFVGFGPVEEPQFVVLVVIDNPKGLIYGGEVAAPVFKEIVSQLLGYRNIPRSSDGLADVNKQRTAAVNSTKPASNSDFMGRPIMPDLRGMNVRQVCEAMTERGLGVQANGSGLAFSQSIAAGSPVDETDVVIVNFAWPQLQLVAPAKNSAGKT